MIGRRDVLKLAGVLMGMGVVKPNLSKAFISHTQDTAIGSRHTFLGKYYAQILDGNRFSIPDEVRYMFPETFYITTHVTDCSLQIFPEAEWQGMYEVINNLPEANEAVMLYKRRVIIPAQKTSLSSDGDIWIDRRLLNDSEISCDVVLIGQIDKFELWSEQKWDEATDIANFDIAKVERDLKDFGL